MNLKQKIIMWVGVLLIVGMCLYPPKIWYLDYKGKDMTKQLGYLFISHTPSHPEVLRLDESSGVLDWIAGSVRIDGPLLLIQCFIMALLTGAGIATATKSKNRNSDAG